MTQSLIEKFQTALNDARIGLEHSEGNEKMAAICDTWEEAIHLIRQHQAEQLTKTPENVTKETASNVADILRQSIEEALRPFIHGLGFEVACGAVVQAIRQHEATNAEKCKAKYNDLLQSSKDFMKESGKYDATLEAALNHKKELLDRLIYVIYNPEECSWDVMLNLGTASVRGQNAIVIKNFAREKHAKLFRDAIIGDASAHKEEDRSIQNAEAPTVSGSNLAVPEEKSNSTLINCSPEFEKWWLDNGVMSDDPVLRVYYKELQWGAWKANSGEITGHNYDEIATQIATRGLISIAHAWDILDFLKPYLRTPKREVVNLEQLKIVDRVLTAVGQQKIGSVKGLSSMDFHDAEAIIRQAITQIEDGR